MEPTFDRYRIELRGQDGQWLTVWDSPGFSATSALKEFRRHVRDIPAFAYIKGRTLRAVLDNSRPLFATV